jgi:hypothetical protein
MQNTLDTRVAIVAEAARDLPIAATLLLADQRDTLQLRW